MKTRNTALVTALAVILQLAGSHTARAQTNTNLFAASFTGFCISTNQNGNLVYKLRRTSDLIRDCITETGVTNSAGLSLMFNVASNSLQVVSGTNQTVLCTPLSFSGGLSLANSNHTRVELEAFVFVETNTIASGLLSATERLSWGTNSQFAAFDLFGRLDYTMAASGTNSPQICRGTLHVTSAVGADWRRRLGQGDNDHADNDQGDND